MSLHNFRDILHHILFLIPFCLLFNVKIHGQVNWVSWDFSFGSLGSKIFSGFQILEVLHCFLIFSKKFNLFLSDCKYIFC